MSDFEERLERLLVARIPEVTGLTRVDRLTGGASQETYRLEVETAAGSGLLAFRRAPVPTDPEDLRPGLDVEAALMTLAGEHGVPEPRVHLVLAPDDELGEGFVMEWLEGETLGPRINRAPELARTRETLAHECGQVLARVHALDVDEAGLADRLQRTEPVGYLEDMTARYHELATPQPMIDYTARWLAEHVPTEGRRTLVHNDFRNGNLLVGPDGIRAVLDWELAHLGDPVRDLGWICCNSWRFGGDGPVGGFGTREDLLAGYESVSGIRIEGDHLRWWEVFGSFWWAISTLGFIVRYREGVDATVEKPVITRRSSEAQMDCVNLLIPGEVTLVEAGPSSMTDQPTAEELVEGVARFLRDDLALDGRDRFLARVAANGLDIAARELTIGPEARRQEAARLADLLGEPVVELDAGRHALVGRLRDGLALDTPGLADHLRQTVANQLVIDQPRYSALRHAGAQTA